MAPGLMISYIFVVDPRGDAGGVWTNGRSPASFYIALRAREYKTADITLLRVEHLNYALSRA